MGSNGLTSAVMMCLPSYLAEKYPETFDEGYLKILYIQGNETNGSNVEGTGMDAGKLVLSPTVPMPRSYRNCRTVPRKIHGMIH